jgi:predicted nucleic acid-binding protein
LLDTDVLSELRKEQRCDSGVRRWLAEAVEEELFISVLALGEIRQGIERLRRRDPAPARALEKWLLRISAEFAGHLLPVDQKVADQWGRLDLPRPMPILDALLAATALVHDLTVVSREEEGFRRAGAQVVNPFAQPKLKGIKMRLNAAAATKNKDARGS